MEIVLDSRAISVWITPSVSSFPDSGRLVVLDFVLDLDLELDSVSQLSVNSSVCNSVTNGDIFKCVSSDNIPHIINTAGRYNQGCKN